MFDAKAVNRHRKRVSGANYIPTHFYQQGTDVITSVLPCPSKKPLIFDWTVLEDQEELEAVLWTRFPIVFLGSEIVWKLSENVSCSRTSEGAEKKHCFKKGFPSFFHTKRRRERSQ